MILLFLIAAVVIFCDQLSKYLIIANFPILPGLDVSLHRVTVIPGFFEIIRSDNPNGAFGIFAGVSPLILVALAAIVLVLLFFYWRKQHLDNWLSVALGLVLGGALGNNLVDRVIRGAVVDWLEFYVGSFHWPTFNIADSAIVVGAIMILWRGLFTGKDALFTKPTKAATPTDSDKK